MGRSVASRTDAMSVHHYMLGRLHFTIGGVHPVVQHLAAEFEPLRSDGAEGQAHIRFNFVADLDPMTGAAQVDRLRILDDRFAVERGGMSYQMRQRADGIDVDIVPRQFNAARRLAPDGLARCADWNHLTKYEKIAKNFVYNVFDYTSQIAQLQLGQSHLHASSFEKDGRGVAIIAWGGVGKTTAMLKLVMEDGWRYLSDDLVTVDRAGTLWRSPKLLQVYGYNVANQAGIRSMLMSGRSLSDRAFWEIRRVVRGPKKVRRRVSAEQLFGADATAARAQLRHAIHIERADTGFSTTTISVADLAARAAATILREISPFVDLAIAMHSSAHHPVLPGVQVMYEATRSVLEEALSRVQPVSVSIPLHADPNEVSAYLRPLLEAGSAAAVTGRVH